MSKSGQHVAKDAHTSRDTSLKITEAIADQQGALLIKIKSCCGLQEHRWARFTPTVLRRIWSMFIGIDYR